MSWPFVFARPEGQLVAFVGGGEDPAPGLVDTITGTTRICPGSGIFGLPQIRGNADIVFPVNFDIDVGSIVRGPFHAYDVRLPEVPEYFQVGVFAQTSITFGTTGCAPLLDNGHYGTWSFEMDGDPLSATEAIASGTGYTPVVLPQPSTVTPLGGLPTIADVSSGFVGRLFTRPAALGPSPWVSDPPDDMDATLFTRDEVGVFRWIWEADWLLHRIEVRQLIVSVKSWDYAPFSAARGELVITPAAGGLRRRGRMVASPGPTASFG